MVCSIVELLVAFFKSGPPLFELAILIWIIVVASQLDSLYLRHKANLY
ncbi:hypothetical protein GPB2148_199 [marine gamma proteobacterium HTCC2148]|nr:hypothetical protein GPB2148_199 [marine gamma proteobacterium HTCC2148]